MRILLVDDSQDIIQFVDMIAEITGHESVSVNNGKDGLAKMQSEKFDMVFLDLTMPDFSGFDVIDALIKEGIMDKQRVVVFTASTTAMAMESELLGKGIHSLLLKPVDIDQLTDKIEEIEALL